jgi:two-component system NtrC family response regulator
MSLGTLLVVDDEPIQAETLAGYLKKRGYTVFTSANAKEGLAAVDRESPDAVLTDVRMPDLDGLSFLKSIKSLQPDTGVIVMTAFGSVQDAVDAMKEGAADYLQKPIDLDQLDLVLTKVLERRRLVRENRQLRERLDARNEFSQLVAGSRVMEEVLGLAARAAKSRATVLIHGESGTGKEMLARAIHLAGPRKDKPFIPVNLAALPEALIESELFGHEKGAFTGADRRRQGRFESADGGTLFIDEVGDIPAAAQVKLLRVLQERRYERVGGTASQAADVRVVAATHRDLESLVREGTFREDLFFRLHVISIRIPPLRERKEEIPLLADHFLRKFAFEENKPVHSISRDAMDRLLTHDFPGNIRELENMVHRAVVMAREEIIVHADLFPTNPTAESRPGSGSLKDRVETLERRLIRESLEKGQGNQSEAARELGISERHLRYKLKKYKMK